MNEKRKKKNLTFFDAAVVGSAPRALFPCVSLCGVGAQSLLHHPPCEQGLTAVGKGGVGGWAYGVPFQG